MDHELHELVVHPTGGDPRGLSPSVDDDANTKQEMTIDEIIEEHVGSFGFSQALQVFLVSLAWIFDSQNTLVTIFSDGQPKWRCAAGADSCSSSSTLCGLKAGEWEWVGGNKSSTVAEWGLICQYKLMAGIPASMFFVGSIFGSAFHGRLADAFLGRKRTVLLSCLLAALTTFLTSLSPNVWVYSALRFSNGFSRSGIGICCIVLATEVVGRTWRGQVGQYGFFLFTVGFLSIPVLAYPTRSHWRTLYRILSLPPLAYSLLVIPFISESPRWLAIRGRSSEALVVLSKLARLNGKRLPPNISIANSVDAASSPSEIRKQESLWSAKWALKRVVLTMIAGFGVGVVYYGVQLNVENLNFNVYFTVGVNALMEIPAVFLGSVLLSVMGRRVLFAASSFLAGISCLLLVAFSSKSKSKKGSWSQLTVESIGFMTASMAFDVLYVYCVELFPTNVRNFAVSMMRQALMLGAAVAPMLVVLGRLSPSMSYVVFGCFAMVSATLTFWLPETRNAPLHETLEEQEKEEGLRSGQ